VSSGRILIVEDEPLLALDLAHRLEQAGFDIVGPAADVACALRLIEREGCDAAVLDIHLGRETSESVAGRLRQRGTPFVTVTGYSDEQRPACFAGSLLFSKPVRSEALIAELDRCLDASLPRD